MRETELNLESGFVQCQAERIVLPLLPAHELPAASLEPFGGGFWQYQPHCLELFFHERHNTGIDGKLVRGCLVLECVLYA